MMQPKKLRFYKPNRDGNGTASEWQLSYKEQERYDKWMFFLSFSKQIGKNEDGNATFDWDKAIRIKLGENDISEILTVLHGQKDSVGTKGSLYHQTPGGGNKIIEFSGNQEGYYLAVSAQDKDKNNSGKIYQKLTLAEGVLLSVLLKCGLETMFAW